MPNLAFLKSLNIDVGSVPWEADDMLGISELSEIEKWAMCAISNIPHLTEDQLLQLSDISGIDIDLLRPFQSRTVPTDLPESGLRQIIQNLGVLFTQPLGEMAKKRFGGTQDMLKSVYAPNKQVMVNNIPSEVLCLYGFSKRALVQSIYNKYTEIDDRYLEVISQLKKMTTPQIARLTAGIYSPPHIEARLRAADLSLAYKQGTVPFQPGFFGGGAGVAGCGLFPEITTWGGPDWLEGSLAFTYKFGTLNMSRRPISPICYIYNTETESWVPKVRQGLIPDPDHPGQFLPDPSHPGIYTDPGQEVEYLTRWNEAPYPNIGITYSKVDTLGNMYIGKYQDPNTINNTEPFSEFEAEGTKEMAEVTLETIVDPGAEDTLAWRPVDVGVDLPSRVHIKGYASRAVLAETDRALFRNRAMYNEVLWIKGPSVDPADPVWFAFHMDKEALTADAYLVGTCSIWLATPDVGDPAAYYECGEVSVVYDLFASPLLFANTDINSGDNEITITAHGRYSGHRVLYTKLSGADIPLITSGNYYYLIRVDNNILQLAATEADALSVPPVAIAITDGGAGTYSLTASSGTQASSPMRHRLLYSAPADSVDPSGLNEITVPLAFRLDNTRDNYLVIHNANGLVRVAINVPTAPNSGYWYSLDGISWVPVII